MIDEEAEAEAYAGGEGPAATTLMGAANDDDDDEIGMADIRKHQEIEEAKKELEELKGSDNEECYEGAGASGQA